MTTTKSTDTTRQLAAREAYLRNLARRSPQLRRRGSSRIEALAVTMLGLAILAFPWGQLGPSRGAEAQPLTSVRLQSGSSERGAMSGCNEARAARPAPAYAGNGPQMDGDGVGVDCAPRPDQRLRSDGVR